MPELMAKHCSFEVCSPWLSPFYSQPWASLIRQQIFTVIGSMGRVSHSFGLVWSYSLTGTVTGKPVLPSGIMPTLL